MVAHRLGIPQTELVITMEMALAALPQVARRMESYSAALCFDGIPQYLLCAAWIRNCMSFSHNCRSAALLCCGLDCRAVWLRPVSTPDHCHQQDRPTVLCS